MRLHLASALLGAALLSFTAEVAAAGKLAIEHAWIRTAPPGAMMLAGYAIVRNEGDAPLTISGARSADFGSISLHQTVSENGVERMRPLGEITLAPGESVAFAPGARHFMLMQPRHELAAGAKVEIHISTKDGADAGAEFIIAEQAP